MPKGILSSAAAAFPLTFADLLVLVGAGCVLYGVYLQWGIPATLVTAGVALIWTGGRLFLTGSR